MFGLKSGWGDKMKTDRTAFIGLTSELEQSTCIRKDGSDCRQVVDIAIKLRNMLVNNDLKLTHSDKVRTLRMINLAKVRALMQETPNGVDIFHALDSISGDVVRLL